MLYAGFNPAEVSYLIC